jgi:hypothetical protein
MGWEFGRTSDDEALKLIVAFLQIDDPQRRGEIVALVEHYANESAKPVPTRRIVYQDNNRITPLTRDV